MQGGGIKLPTSCMYMNTLIALLSTAYKKRTDSAHITRARFGNMATAAAGLSLLHHSCYASPAPTPDPHHASGAYAQTSNLSFAGKYADIVPACSPMTRVAKVLWAAAKRKRKGRQAASMNGHADNSLAAAMRKTHSYDWLQNAVKDSPAGAPEGVASYGPCAVPSRLAVLRLMFQTS